VEAEQHASSINIDKFVQALSDIPAVMFAEELVQAYPEAKVILTTRSVDSWYNSMMRTVCNPRYYSRLFRLACRFDKRERDSLKMSDKYREICWHNDFERRGKSFFEQHNDSIRKLVPPERLLQFEAKYGILSNRSPR
jgi:Sulfotransferase domain